jgi:hypothetical protein
MKNFLFGVASSDASVPAHLELLTVNRGWHPMTLGSIIAASLFVSIEFSMTVLFVLGYLALRYNAVASEVLLSFLVVVTLGLIAGLGLLTLRHYQGGLALLSILYVLTPVFASLARSVSDDTITNTVALLLLLHIFWYDYFANEHRPLVSANAGLMSAILLCSRLATYNQVFAIILLGIVLFALWPIVFIDICISFPRVHIVLGVALPVAMAAGLFVFFSRFDPPFQFCAYVFIGVVFVINGVAPVVFFRLQRLKHVLGGQWAEARII